MDPLLIIGSSLVWAVVSYFRRDVALAFLVLLVPTYQIRFSIFFIPCTLLEVCICILFLAWAVDTFRKKERIRLAYPWLLVAFLVAGAIATVASVDVRAGLGLLKAYIIEPVLVYVVAVHTIRAREHVRRIEWALLGLVLVVAVVALLQAFHVVSVPEPYASEIPRRVTSIYDFPTAIGKLLGPILAFLLPILLFFKSSWHSGYHRRTIVAGLAVALGSLALLFSVNRGALVGLFVAGFVVACFSKRKILVASLAGLCIIVSLFMPVVRNELSSILSGEDTSTDVRLIMWKGTMRLIEANPVFGAGLGGFPVLYDQFRDAAHVELFPNPDSLFLTLWAEMGILGFVVFIALFFVWVRASFRILRRAEYGSRDWIFGLGAFASMVAFVVHGIVDTPYFKNDLAVAFWVLFAILVIIEGQYTSGNKRLPETTTLS